MTLRVPFCDLSRVHKPIKAEVLLRIASIIDRSDFVLGAEVQEFERTFSELIGVEQAIGVGSGFDALKIALQASGIGTGDEVLLPANTFIATAFAVSAVGAKPVLVDVESGTYNLDPGLLEGAISTKTKAIIPVHLYGQSASLEPILSISEKYGLDVIEDAAQSHGSLYREKCTGTWGRVGCFSFYPGKNLGAMGEAGALVTSDPEISIRARMIRDVGQREKYHHEFIGGNSRLHTLQAAVLLAKLPILKALNQQRQNLAIQYFELLSGIDGIVLPKVQKDRTHVYHLFVIQIPDFRNRDRLREFLMQKGVQTGIHYPTPIHLQKCYSHLGYAVGDFPVTERLASSVLSLPLFPGMTLQELELVTSSIRDFFRC